MQAEPGPERMTLQLKSDARLLRVVRAMVRSFGEMAGFDRRRNHAITLAVDESCANVMRHCYGGGAHGDIELTLALEEAGEGRRLVIRLRDFGPRISRERVSPVPIDPLRPGGLGLHLIHDVMDSVELDTSVEEGNLLVLSCACPATPRPEGVAE